MGFYAASKSNMITIAGKQLYKSVSAQIRKTNSLKYTQTHTHIHDILLASNCFFEYNIHKTLEHMKEQRGQNHGLYPGSVYLAIRT